MKRIGDRELFVFAWNVEQDLLVYYTDRNITKASNMETIHSMLGPKPKRVQQLAVQLAVRLPRDNQ